MSTQVIAKRLVAVASAVLAFLVGLVGLQPPPAQAANTMLIVIGAINVGTPVMATKDSCNGYMEHRDPVVPVMIQASFFGDSDPVGPYATAEWDGGYGSSDHHFGTSTASARSQRFHILVRASSLAGWRGAGEYRFKGLVQDVGLQGGFTVKSKDVTLPPPSPTVATVKCTITPVLTPMYVLDQVKGAVIKEIQKKVCAICVELKSTFGKVKAYADGLNGLLYDAMVDDPPDLEFQTLAQPVQAPVVAPPAGLSAGQRAAFVQLTDRLATDLGTMRAVYATVNRVWGADNAASTFWHRKQLAHLATLTERAAQGFEAQPALWAALVDSFGADLPDFQVGPAEVNDSMSGLERGLPADEAGTYAQLGITPAEQQKVATVYATYVNPQDVQPSSSRDALKANNSADVAQALRVWGDWARSAAGDDAPVITSVTPAELPSSGGTSVTVQGTNLRGVTGFNFGPSDVGGKGQGVMTSRCAATSCQVRAPAGRGTVDVVAIAPGGTSGTSARAKVTYVEPSTPHVANVFPRQGGVAGGTWISVFGDGLEGGRVDFGTVPAADWSCSSETRCTAKVPASGLPGTVPVTVVNERERSAPSAASQYEYLATAPPATPAPSVTGVSPSTGTHLGGVPVTLTGDNFTGATSVVLQSGTSQTTVSGFAVTDDEHITLTTPSFATGARSFVVRGPGGVSAVTAGSSFTGTAAAPTVTGVSPTSGSALGGTKVTITGTGLTNAFVSAGDQFVSGTVCAPTTCTFTTNPLEAGDPLGTVHVRASTSDGQSALTDADRFTFTAGPRPVVTGLEPDTGSTAGGGTLVVTGTNLNGGEVTVGGADADGAGLGNRCAPTSCVVEVPPHPAGDVPVVVTTHAGASAASPAATYSYVAPARPVITTISPRQQWAQGVDQIRITGQNLDGARVFFGTEQARDAECSRAQCTLPFAPTQDAAKTVDVTVRTPGGTSATGPHTTFMWIAPTVTSVSPASGWNDGTAEVTVTGTNLEGGRIAFGTGTAPQTCVEDTTCTVTVPKSTGTGPVDVRATAVDQSTRSQVTAASRFTYTTRPLPTITSVSPDHGSKRGRERVTITGTALKAAEITVGGTDASAITCQQTSCTFTTPFRDTVGPVHVVATTSAGASATGTATRFTYETSGVPTVTSVSPTSGSTAGGTTVTLTGDDLVGTIIRFGDAQQSADCNRTTCVVTTRANAAGNLVVTAQSDAGTSTARGVTYSFVAPPRPAVTRVSPAGGPASGGTSVTLTGTDLYAGRVSVGGTQVSSTCTATTCTYRQPAGSAGDVPVTVTTPGGTSTAATFRYSTVTMTELTIPGVTTGTGGGEVVRGIGGDIWFTLRTQHAIGRVKADGSIVTYPAGAGAPRPGGITLGPDGRMWFAEPGTSKIGAMTGDGTLTEYPVPGRADDVRYVEPGADGRLWFTMSSGAIGAITTTGTVTKYQVPDPSVVPYHLLAGPDGRMWFTEYAGRSIGAVAMDGTFSEYPLESPDVLSWDLKTGPDGRLWFTQTIGQNIAAVDPATGAVTTYRLPGDVANPQGLTFGPDGRFWFVAPDVDEVMSWDPTTQEVVHHALPGSGSGRTPKYLAMDGRGDLWVTLVGSPKLLRVTGLTGTAAPRVTAVGPTHGVAGARVTVTGAHLGGATRVTVGGATASFDVVDPAHLSVTVPAGSGAAPVVVTTPQGTSAPGAVFTYGAPPAPAPTVTSVDPPSGLVAGGNQVTVTGTGLAGAALEVGAKAATGVSCTATRCTATVPSGSLGTVQVVATTAAGSSATSARSAYTYLAPAPAAPVVTRIAPATGPTTGGTPVTVTGTGLAGGTVTFGDDVAAGSCTATTCTVSSPSGGVGTVHVQVTTEGGTSARVAADRFTYTAAGDQASTTTVSVDPGSVQVGEPVTFTVQVAPATATGEVRLREGSVALGTAVLDDGVATFETSALTVGQHRVVADYLGDATYAGSTAAAPATVTVTAAPTKDPTTTTLQTSAATVTEGQLLTLTARVAPQAATGQVTFTDGGVVLGRAPLTAGVATLATALTGAGAHTVVASYGGDEDHEPSVSAAQTVTVRAFQLTSTTLAGPATSTLQAPVTLTSTTTPAGAPGSVLFLDQTTGTTLGTVAVSGGKAALTTSALGTGRHHLRAVFSSSDPAFSASASELLTITVTGPTTPPPPPPPPTYPTAQAPGAPLAVVAKALAKRKVVVTWSAPAASGSSAVTSYVVTAYQGTKVAKKVTVPGGTTKATFAKLAAGKKYRFVVVAANAVGQGPASASSKAVKAKR